VTQRISDHQRKRCKSGADRLTGRPS